MRFTALHAGMKNGAEFEDVGQYWRRARIRRRGSTMRSAKGGLLDASTLGKIDIQGPDARGVLEPVYTNAWDRSTSARRATA